MTDDVRAARPEFLAQRIQTVFAPCDEDQIVAVRREYACEFCTDTGRGTGNQNAWPRHRSALRGRRRGGFRGWEGHLA